MGNPTDSLIERARELRRELTPAEKRLWRELLDRRCAGFKFRRQHIIGPFIVDFYCASCSLSIEIDGETHLGRELHDVQRQKFLEVQGLKILRFWNTEVYDDLEAVMEAIYIECEQRKTQRKTE